MQDFCADQSAQPPLKKMPSVAWFSSAVLSRLQAANTEFRKILSRSRYRQKNIALEQLEQLNEPNRARTVRSNGGSR